MEKYPALQPKFNLKSRTELLECDYLYKLNEDEKAFLNQFNEEYVNGVLDRKNPENNLHNTRELIKDCDDRNNARNRCVMTRAKAAGKHSYLSEIREEQLSDDKMEDKLIYQIDKKIKRRRKKRAIR